MSTYKSYEVNNLEALNKCKRAIWQGVFNRTEGEGKNKRFFIRVNDKTLSKIKKKHPFMVLAEIKN